MAKKSMILKQQKEPKFSSRRYNRCKLSAVSASGSWLTRARSPV